MGAGEMEKGGDGTGPGCRELGGCAGVCQSVGHALRDRGELLQLCENPVESSAGAARGGESQPGGFIGHCGRCVIGYM